MKRSYPYPVGTASNSVEYTLGVSAGFVMQFASGTATRDRLTADRIYYVRTDGSDSNNGLTDSAAGAFLTIQAAVNAVTLLDQGRYRAKVKIADGTYTGSVFAVGPNLVSSSGVIGANDGVGLEIEGNTTTPANVHLDTASSLAAIYVWGMEVQVSGIKVSNSVNNGVTADGPSGILGLDRVFFGTCTNHHIQADGGALVYLAGNYTISGGADVHWRAVDGGKILDYVGVTVTLSGTPAFADSFASSETGIINTYGGTTFSGAATGARYLVEQNGVIKTSGSTLPGDSAGSAATGGQYS
jgi:hypothetical protein